ncbi:MAG: GNAT family N-acetyltransferase [Myxococcota bacterium]
MPLLGDTLPTLATARLRLRHVRASDVDRVEAVFGDPVAMAYWSHDPLPDRAAAEAYVGQIERGFANETLYQWVLTEARDDTLIGTVTLAGVDRRHLRAELGYMIAPECWRRGYATEAAGAAVQFAFDTLGLHRIEADIHPDNHASRGVLVRLGFRAEGLRPERWFTGGQWSASELYALLRPVSRAG